METITERASRNMASHNQSAVQTHSPRTSLIDAEWDWIANRLIQRDGQWAVASVINPSLARVSYCPVEPLPLTNRLPLRVVEGKALEPGPKSRSAARAPVRPWLRGLAVVATLAVGLAGGALLQRAGTAPAPSQVAQQFVRDEALQASASEHAHAPQAESYPTTRAASPPLAVSAPSSRHPAHRRPARARPAQRASTARRPIATDNPY
jgi:hypothetical protein